MGCSEMQECIGLVHESQFREAGDLRSWGGDAISSLWIVPARVPILTFAGAGSDEARQFFCTTTSVTTSRV